LCSQVDDSGWQDGELGHLKRKLPTVVLQTASMHPTEDHQLVEWSDNIAIRFCSLGSLPALCSLSSLRPRRADSGHALLVLCFLRRLRSCSCGRRLLLLATARATAAAAALFALPLLTAIAAAATAAAAPLALPLLTATSLPATVPSTLLRLQEYIPGRCQVAPLGIEVQVAPFATVAPRIILIVASPTKDVEVEWPTTAAAPAATEGTAAQTQWPPSSAIVIASTAIAATAAAAVV